MEKDYIIDISFIKSLRQFGNTIISVERFNNALKKLFKDENPDTVIDNEILENKDYNTWANGKYLYLKNKFIEEIEKAVGKKVKLTYLPADEPAINVDCIKIEVTK